MSSLEQTTRRAFLRRTAGAGIIAAVVAPLPIALVRTPPELRAPQVIDVNIAGIPFKLVGIEHTAEFAKKNYATLQDLVRNASCVVSEVDPHQVENHDVDNEGKAYFTTVIDLCHDYAKCIISLDPLTPLASLTEMGLGALGMGIALGTGKELVVAPQLSRREFAAWGVTAMLALYIEHSSMLVNAAYANGINQQSLRQKYYFNHVADQRNVELTNRLLALPSLLTADDLQQGEYVLVNFGNGHTIGINDYLRHPVARKIKSMLYGTSYSLMDSDEIARFHPTKNGWEKQVLRA